RHAHNRQIRIDALHGLPDRFRQRIRIAGRPYFEVRPTESLLSVRKECRRWRRIAETVIPRIASDPDDFDVGALFKIVAETLSNWIFSQKELTNCRFVNYGDGGSLRQCIAL